MLLRSSSTPILGSLLSSESPNNFDHNRCPPCSDKHNSKLSFHATNQNYHPFSWNFSSIFHAGAGFSEKNPEFKSCQQGFRRAQSDGNLQVLAALEVDDGSRNSSLMKSSKKQHGLLQTTPSFSVYNFRNVEEEGVQGGNDQQVHFGDGLERSVTIGEDISSKGADFCFSNDNALGFDQQVLDEATEELLSIGGIGSASMFLAGDIGIDDPGLAFNGNSGGGGSNFPPGGPNGPGDASDVEAYYKRMVEENPSSALVLRNYAKYLHETKKDFSGAEEYYSRAILAEPGDGEVLSQFAQFIWQFYHDSKRASHYFKQAVQAATDDSHVLAAYANFLWETEEDEGEGGEDYRSSSFFSNSYDGVMVSAI